MVFLGRVGSEFVGCAESDDTGEQKEAAKNENADALENHGFSLVAPDCPVKLFAVGTIAPNSGLLGHHEVTLLCLDRLIWQKEEARGEPVELRGLGWRRCKGPARD